MVVLMLLLSQPGVQSRCSVKVQDMKQITPKIALEILGHEAIVREAYKDSVDVWTWGVGITEASGHQVYPRYLDRPQSLHKCLNVYLQILRDAYLPAVLDRFAGLDLKEHELGAALSFHYNTGGIGMATWVDDWIKGDIESARSSFMNWSKPLQIVPRRKKERDLFFDGIWSSEGTVCELLVDKTTYRPDPATKREVAVRAIVSQLL